MSEKCTVNLVVAENHSIDQVVLRLKQLGVEVTRENPLTGTITVRISPELVDVVGDLDGVDALAPSVKASIQ